MSAFSFQALVWCEGWWCFLTTRLEARKKGCQVTEQALQDGSIRLQIIEGV
jgi:hypothetical protein